MYKKNVGNVGPRAIYRFTVCGGWRIMEFKQIPSFYSWEKRGPRRGMDLPDILE